jgi:hypothetical protein
MAVPTRDVPLQDARAGIEARLRDTLAGWGNSELSPAPGPNDEAALQSFLRTFEGALLHISSVLQDMRGVSPTQPNCTLVEVASDVALNSMCRCAEAKLKGSGLIDKGKLLQGTHLIMTAGTQGQLSAEGATALLPVTTCGTPASTMSH